MDGSSLTSLFDNGFSDTANTFDVSYQQQDGTVLHADVRAHNKDHYEVFIREKNVIIHCTTDANGALSCKLNSKENPRWVDGISKELAKRLEGISAL